jgi:hypothetical protein
MVRTSVPRRHPSRARSAISEGGVELQEPDQIVAAQLRVIGVRLPPRSFGFGTGSWFNVQVPGGLRSLPAAMHFRDKGERRPVHLLQPPPVPQIVGP